jgi:transposase
MVVTDEQDRVHFEKRLPNNLEFIIEKLQPYKDELLACVVESTFNWYWLVDGLQDNGFDVQLVNTTAVKQYDGLKYIGDHQDAFHLAHLMRLGILPTGYIYPKEQRAIRDLLRRRMSLVRSASTQLISVQSQIWRSTGIRIKSGDLRKPVFAPPPMDQYTLQAIDAGLSVYQTIQEHINILEQSAHQAVEAHR